MALEEQRLYSGGTLDRFAVRHNGSKPDIQPGANSPLAVSRALLATAVFGTCSTAAAYELKTYSGSKCVH